MFRFTIRDVLWLTVVVAANEVAAATSCFAQTSKAPNSVLEPMEFIIGSGEVQFGVEPNIVPRGGAVRVRCEMRIWRQTGGDVAYNPFLQETYRLPAQIVVVSADTNRRYELLRPPAADADKIPDQPWVETSGLKTLGRELHFCVGSEGESGIRCIDLPPGEYWVQAIYNNWLNATWLRAPGFFAGPLPTDGTVDQPRLFGNYKEARMNEPIAISKPVRFAVVEPNRSPPDEKTEVGLPNATKTKSPIAVELELITPRPVFGRDLTVALRFTNRSARSVEVFAPYCDGHIGPYNRKIELALLTMEGTYVGDLWRIDGGSFAGLSPSLWVKFAPEATASTRHTRPAGFVPDADGMTPIYVKPGKYLLEARIHEHFLSGRPSGMIRRIIETTSPEGRDELKSDFEKAGIKDDTGDPARTSYEEWERTFPGPEVCRSNRVELEILPRTGD